MPLTTSIFTCLQEQRSLISDPDRCIRSDEKQKYCHVDEFNIVTSYSHQITQPSLTHCGRVTQICVFNTVKLGHLQVLLSATPQGGMFPQVSHPQALLGSLVSIS